MDRLTDEEVVTIIGRGLSLIIINPNGFAGQRPSASKASTARRPRRTMSSSSTGAPTTSVTHCQKNPKSKFPRKKKRRKRIDSESRMNVGIFTQRAGVSQTSTEAYQVVCGNRAGISSSSPARTLTIKAA